MKSIMETRKGTCFLCEAEGYTENHHIFDGANRKLSTRYGLMVYLCIRCHNLPPDGVHFNAERMRKLQAAGQAAFEAKHGTREKFREIFGKNYIYDEVTD